MNEQQKPNERAGFASPGGMAILRAAVAGYLIYLGFTLIRDLLSGSSGLPPAAAWGIGAVFMLAGALFLVYAWRRFRAEQKAEAAPRDGENTTNE